MTKLSVRAGLLAAATMLTATVAQAGGFYLQEQSVRGAGRAFSGEAADTGAASLWWNPASIGGIAGGSAAIAGSAIRPKGMVENVNTRIARPGQAVAPVGGVSPANDPIDNGLLPSGAVAYSVTPQIAVGLAVTSPFSFTTDYDDNSWVRYTADKTKLRTIDLQPSIAFAPNEMLSFGVALNAEHADATLSNKLPNLSPLLADGNQRLEGKGWDFGWSAGAQVRSGALQLGASYKSSVKHKLKGTVVIDGLLGPLAPQNRSVDATATFRTPWQAIVGARYKLGAATLNAQVVRFGWNKFDSIKLGAPLNTALPEDYRNTWSYAVGVDYDLSEMVTLRGGVQRDHTPTRNGERDARVPDTNRWNFAAGATAAVSKGVMIEGAFNYIDFKNGTIDRTTAAYAGTAVQTPILVDGRVRNARALVFSLGGRFAF